MKTTLLLVVTALALTTAARAEDPQDIAERYCAAVKAGGFVAMADFLHPAELERFRARLMPVVEKVPAQHQPRAIGALFGPKATLESVRAMSSKAFMLNFLKLMERDSAGLDVAECTIIGTVKERKDLVHAVGRISVALGDSKATTMEVLTLLPHGKGWGVQLSGELESLVQQVESQLSALSDR